MTADVTVADAGLHLRDLTLRIPFSYGVTTLEAVPHALVRVEATVDGDATVGLAADHFVPRWFRKDPDLPVAEELAGLVEVCERATGHARAVGAAPSAFDLWRATYDRQREWAAGTDHPPLEWGFGVSLVERALVHAVCRATGRPFPRAIADGTLGFDPGAVHDELDGLAPAALLPDAPSERIDVRHTVGYTDPLTGADVDPAGPAAGDGLPRTLADVVERYGVDHFKLKLAGDVDADAERLRRIVAVVGERVADPVYTLDANEQYDTVADLRELWSLVEREDALAGLSEGIAFVEQPFPRSVALSRDVGEALSAWADGPPVVVDESDATTGDLPTALDRGYAGTSYKNCKGLFKGFASACLLARRRRESEGEGEGLLLSGEDLSTVGPVALQQDLAAMATLGLGHVERNGHHYFRGLSAFPGAVQERVLEAHGDLYRRHDDGFATLAIEDGRIRTASALAAPFGMGEAVPRSPAALGFVPAAEWSVDGVGDGDR